MSSTARKTKCAANQDGMVCFLLDVRGRASQHYLRVWSYSKNKEIDLPYRYRGKVLTRDETPESKKWAAVSVVRWLANKETLWTKPKLPALVPEFCRQSAPDLRTEQEKIDDGERALAQYVVDQANKYLTLPGQHLQDGKGDARNGAIFA